MQCCGTGTAGTVTFCLSGTGTVMYSGSGTGIGPGSNIKCDTKVKIQKERPTFWESMLLLALKTQGFVGTNFWLFKNSAK
jgi:hypothetical protein